MSAADNSAAMHAERDTFEVWARSKGYDLAIGRTGYDDHDTYHAWEAWQEATRRASAREAALLKCFNPREWTPEMDRAWHLAIPDVSKAFADLFAAAAPEENRG